MKILVSYRVAPRIRGWETGSMVAAAFRRLGHDVDEYAREYESNKWLCRGYEDQEMIFPYNDCPWKEIIEWTPDRVHATEYDLVLNMECNDPEPQYFELTQVKTEKRAVWHFDTSYYQITAFNHITNYEPDHVFFANDNFRDYHFKNSSWLPYAADPRFFRPLDTEKTIDVGLVGSDRPERRRLIDFLEKNGVRAQLISGVFKEDYIDALASCRIVINENPPAGTGLLNMRTFEASAAGTALLSSDECCNAVLIPGSETLIYTNAVSAVDHCRVLLSDPVGLIEMSKRGQGTIRERHMYDHRAQEILDVLF